MISFMDVWALFVAFSSILFAVTLVIACCEGNRPEMLPKDPKKGIKKPDEDTTKSGTITDQPTSFRSSVMATDQLTTSSPFQSVHSQSTSSTVSTKSEKKPPLDTNDRKEDSQTTQLQLSSAEDANEKEKERKSLVLEPRKLYWDTNGGLRRIALMNPTKERCAVKVRCSDNSLYRVNPVYSFVEPGGSVGIDILRDMGRPKLDKMVFVTAKVNAEEEHAKSVFRSTGDESALVFEMSKPRHQYGQSNRERTRQLHVNEAFSQLRRIIPCYPINKKMSKHEILRGAIHYLRILEYLLGMRTTFT
ncbi:unnamed protein product [Anisakis simplex]|uniref:Major sperm protein n=1 Tax=Anisakis simplex TaxID=6269 RepID=A0A158PNN1_ANISI|nr:unnamed protein product [Anisakis simplex]